MNAAPSPKIALCAMTVPHYWSSPHHHRGSKGNDSCRGTFRLPSLRFSSQRSPLGRFLGTAISAILAVAWTVHLARPAHQSAIAWEQTEGDRHGYVLRDEPAVQFSPLRPAAG